MLAKGKPSIQEVHDTFRNAFPKADKNLDFFLGHLSNQFGEGGEIWEKHRHEAAAARTKETLDGFVL